MHLRFSPKIRLLRASPQSPGKVRFAALRTLHRWSGYAPLRALKTWTARRYRWACSFSFSGCSIGAPNNLSTLALAVKTSCISLLAVVYSA